jgi:hypothetical protein
VSGIPQEFTKEQFEEAGLSVTESEIRAVNHNVYMLERAFKGQGAGEVFVPDDLGEDISPEWLAMLTDYARNFLRDKGAAHE